MSARLRFGIRAIEIEATTFAPERHIQSGVAAVVDAAGIARRGRRGWATRSVCADKIAAPLRNIHSIRHSRGLMCVVVQTTLKWHQHPYYL